jgi:hypothetical protein
MTRSASAPSGTLSMYLVVTLAPSAFPSACGRVVLERVAGVADGAHVDEADLERLAGLRGLRGGREAESAIAHAASVASVILRVVQGHRGLLSGARAGFYQLTIGVETAA